jgi:hypothetical protein
VVLALVPAVVPAEHSHVSKLVPYNATDQVPGEIWWFSVLYSKYSDFYRLFLKIAMLHTILDWQKFSKNILEMAFPYLISLGGNRSLCLKVNKNGSFKK